MLSVVDNGPPSPCPSPFNLAAHVLTTGRKTPDKTALSVLGLHGAEHWSYGTLERSVLGVASALAARGLAPSARVLLRLGNTVEFPIAFLGCAAADLVPVPVSAQLTAPELTGLIDQLEPDLIFADPVLAMPETNLPVIPRGALAEMSAREPLTPVPGDPNRPGYIVFTSGTSGRPRGVVHAHRAVWAREMMRDGWYGLTAQDRVLHAGAFNWTYTLGTGLLDPWAAGATALIPQEGITAQNLGPLIAAHEATIFAAAPGVYRQLLRHAPKLDAPHLRHGLSAGERLAADQRDAWTRATDTPVFEAFGMSECSTFISGNPTRPAPLGAVGYAQNGRHIAVLGEDGRPVPRGTEGVLAIARNDPGLMLGYFRADDETAARMTGAWFVTGDTAVMEGDGAIHYRGRADDMLNAGGLRVSPLEIEAVLATFPGIDEAAVTEVEARPGVTIIAAFFTAPSDLDADALSRHMSGNLARYKHPRHLQRVQSLPKSANGKLLRRSLRDIYEARP